MAIYKRGRRWWIEFEHNGRRVRQSTAAWTKREARAELEAMKTDLKRSHLIMAEQRKTPFKKLAESVPRRICQASEAVVVTG